VAYFESSGCALSHYFFWKVGVSEEVGCVTERLKSV